MSARDRWLLPEGIAEVLPAEAAALERARRRLIDLFERWGYELVVPPFVEYLESLLTGTGGDLDLQTFKLTDQLTGRLMGVRADMTPQVARIDAHSLRRVGPVRLCYLGTVLHTLPDGIARSRSPIQVGAELYGHAGMESDVEVLCLMLESLASAGVRPVHVDLGHVGVFRGLAREAGLDAEQERQLAEVLDGYRAFYDFDPRELHLIEALRTLRLIHYAGWLARRWDDPAFPVAFPWFGTPRYWQDRILELREQIALMDEAPLACA